MEKYWGLPGLLTVIIYLIQAIVEQLDPGLIVFGEYDSHHVCKQRQSGTVPEDTRTITMTAARLIHHTWTLVGIVIGSLFACVVVTFFCIVCCMCMCCSTSRSRPSTNNRNTSNISTVSGDLFPSNTNIHNSYYADTATIQYSSRSGLISMQKYDDPPPSYSEVVSSQINEGYESDTTQRGGDMAGEQLDYR